MLSAERIDRRLRKGVDEDVPRNFTPQGMLVTIGFNGDRPFEWCTGQNVYFDSWEQSQISQIAEHFGVVIADFRDNRSLPRLKF